jgi:hypothetical protein
MGNCATMKDDSNDPIEASKKLFLNLLFQQINAKATSAISV